MEIVVLPSLARLGIGKIKLHDTNIVATVIIVMVKNIVLHIG